MSLWVTKFRAIQESSSISFEDNFFSAKTSLTSSDLCADKQ